MNEYENSIRMMGGQERLKRGWDAGFKKFVKVAWIIYRRSRIFQSSTERIKSAYVQRDRKRKVAYTYIERFQYVWQS